MAHWNLKCSIFKHRWYLILKIRQGTKNQCNLKSKSGLDVHSPLFEAWKESWGGIFSIWAESLEELSKFVWSLIFSTAYLVCILHMLWYVDMVVFLSCVVIKALLDKQIPQLHTYILHSMFDMWTICWVVKGCHHMKSIKEALWSSESSGSTGSYQQGHHGHHYQQSGSQQLKISWYTSGSGDLYQLERGMQAYIYDNFGNLWWNFWTKLLYITKFICIIML